MQNEPVPSVFIVDDSEPVRERLKELIETGPCARIVGEAASVASAIAGIKAWQPDYVVLDYQLQNGTGLDVLREVRCQAPSSCFIVLTNHATTGLRDAFMNAGAQFLLDKSFEFERLPQLIAELGARDQQDKPEVLLGR